MAAMPGFSTHLLDEALARKRREREELRRRVLTQAFVALDELSQEIPFFEAYLFGSVVKPHKFREDSDVDVAILVLPDEHFFRAMTFLSARLGRDVDLVQLEVCPFAEKVKKEGIKWTKKR